MELTSIEIKRAVQTLKEGGIIVYPTEGVYGVGCDPFNETAVLRLLKIKKRSVKKGVILVVSSWDQARDLIEIDPLKNSLVKSHQSDPITWVFPATKKVPGWIVGDFKSVAIRCFLHSEAKRICQKFGGPIVSTSANTSMKPAVTRYEDLEKSLLDSVDFVVKGKTGGLKTPTPIYDAKTGNMLRK